MRFGGAPHRLTHAYFICLQKRRSITALRKEKRPRINEEIRAPKVLLVDGENTEEMTVAEALQRAKDQELDLIEISPKANPPVVKISDFGRFQYQLKKKEQKQKAHNKQTEVKMLRFGFRTEQHDLQRIADRAREFLGERHMVRLVVRLRGREMTNKDYARQKLLGLVKSLADVADVEQDVRMQGNMFSAVMKVKR